MKRTLIMTLAAVLLSVIIDLSLHRGEADFPWSNVSGFFALFGLIGCVALIVIPKWLGHSWLQRKEDYYDPASREVPLPRRERLGEGETRD